MSVSPSIEIATDGAPAGARPRGWVVVCELDRILVDGGVAALVHGRQVAVFRLRSGELYAIDNRDPCAGANVLARGILGDTAGQPYVASPLHKQRFDLASGECLDDPGVAVATYPVRVVRGVVEVAPG